ncbi:DUF6443 domain-containing protein [Mucilaginibacter sp. AW1-7]|uniref:DUF6443 domain-containing protein n=1 Tax=Mucilaginibacter sp. AW1-7 TaxID=3349874 RepID=UPI003F734D52
MAITHITIKPGLKQLSLVLSLMLYAFGSKAQTYLAPPATLTTTPAAGSYYSNTSITLNPTFSFTAATGSSLSLYIVNPDCVPLASLPSATQNYIVTSVPRVGGVVDASGLANRTTCELMQTVQYIDGLGRPLQTVQVKGSPLVKDVVQPYAYDAYSREAIKYLPYTSPTADGSYKTAAITSEIGNFYNPGGAGVSGTQQSNGIVYNPNPFSSTNFESSPLNRVQEQGAPGTDWQPSAGHTVKLVYTNNNTTALSDVNNSFIANLYTVTISADQSRTLVLGNSAGNYYPAGQLYVTISKDENWVSGKPGTTEEYKDKEGHVVLKRTFNLVGTTVQTLSTYYVYDDLGELAFVLPPMSNADNALPDQTTQNNLCYQYRYDERGRLSRKKLPGKDWEYIVYNSLDQPVLTQDGVQRLSNQWTVTKYDALGRVIMTGLWTDASASTQSVLQVSIYGQAQWDVRNTSDTNTGYTISSYPSISSYLSINYYDDYSFSNITGLPTAFNAVPTGASSQTRGQLTANKTYVLGTTDALWAVNYYDGLGRNIQTYKQHYLGGSINVNNYDVISSSYDFTSAITATTRKHYTSASTTSPAVTIANTYAYDHMGRKLTTSEQINGGTNVMLSKNDYNEIGQLMAKHLHSATGVAPFLQDISYTYNERGWLQKINDPSVTPTTTKLFAEQLNYNSTQYGATPQYNGNIAEQAYNVYNSSTAGIQTVKYGYDLMNRLLSGTSSTGYSETGITYDLNGNIQTLNRTGPNAAALSYAYYNSGNQLQTVTNNGSAFRSYGAYDANGNAPGDGTGKAFAYNLLNLPQTVTATGLSLSYTYDATGNKLRKVSNGTATDYISGIQYKADGTIDFVQTEEGKANRSGTSYVYEYTLTDHLGNNRVTFDQTSGKVGEDDYYPFGLNVHRLQNAGNKYLYNKKELQEELGQYDYGARFYDPVIGRWGAVDPMAEKYYSLSIYNYTADNPVIYIDPTGAKIEFAEGTGKKEKHEFMTRQRYLNKHSPTAKALWKQLKKSDNVHTIHLNEKDKNGQMIVTKTVPKGAVDPQKGAGTDMYIDLTDETNDAPGGKLVNQAHEQAHAVDYDNGQDWSQPTAPWDMNKSPEENLNAGAIAAFNKRVAGEKSASHTENIIRAELDPTGTTIPLRELYKNIPLNLLHNGIPEIKQININVIKDGYRYYKKQ